MEVEGVSKKGLGVKARLSGVALPLSAQPINVQNRMGTFKCYRESGAVYDASIKSPDEE